MSRDMQQLCTQLLVDRQTRSLAKLVGLVLAGIGIEISGSRPHPLKLGASFG